MSRFHALAVVLAALAIPAHAQETKPMPDTIYEALTQKLETAPETLTQTEQWDLLSEKIRRNEQFLEPTPLQKDVTRQSYWSLLLLCPEIGESYKFQPTIMPVRLEAPTGTTTPQLTARYMGSFTKGGVVIAANPQAPITENGTYMLIESRELQPTGLIEYWLGIIEPGTCTTILPSANYATGWIEP